LKPVTRRRSKGKFLVLLPNIRLGWKGVADRNATAYYAAAKVTVVKRLVLQASALARHDTETRTQTFFFRFSQIRFPPVPPKRCRFSPTRRPGSGRYELGSEFPVAAPATAAAAEKSASASRKFILRAAFKFQKSFFSFFLSGYFSTPLVCRVRVGRVPSDSPVTPGYLNPACAHPDPEGLFDLEQE
jgi:hypothetical protein